MTQTERQLIEKLEKLISHLRVKSDKRKTFQDLERHELWVQIEVNLESEITALRQQVVQEEKMPEIVCICGSGRFLKEMHKVEERLTLEGKIVLMIGVNTKDVARTENLEKYKPMLDELHLRKIDLSDAVLIVAVNNYIGESTKREIEYATSKNKKIEYYTPTEEQEPEGEPKYDKDYLNECIEKATPNLSKIKDVDKEIAEIRGEGPEEVTAEEVLSKYKSESFIICAKPLLSAMVYFRSDVLKAMEEYESQSQINLKEEIRKLRFMIDNGLGWKDMRNDIIMPHEI
jgi:hypothetical protein